MLIMACCLGQASTYNWLRMAVQVDGPVPCHPRPQGATRNNAQRFCAGAGIFAAGSCSQSREGASATVSASPGHGRARGVTATARGDVGASAQHPDLYLSQRERAPCSRDNARGFRVSASCNGPAVGVSKLQPIPAPPAAGRVPPRVSLPQRTCAPAEFGSEFGAPACAGIRNSVALPGPLPAHSPHHSATVSAPRRPTAQPGDTVVGNDLPPRLVRASHHYLPAVAHAVLLVSMAQDVLQASNLADTMAWPVHTT
jgi:hypothetical protein